MIELEANQKKFNLLLMLLLIDKQSFSNCSKLCYIFWQFENKLQLLGTIHSTTILSASLLTCIEDLKVVFANFPSFTGRTMVELRE